MEVEPTSLNRGEGLAAGWSGEVGGVEGKRKGESGSGEVVVEEENEQRSTVMWLMCVSNSAHPTKIAVDIDTCGSDNKIKTCIIL
jgi:hypothetical protein